MRRVEIVRSRRICTLEWVNRVDGHRWLGPIGNLPPAEGEAVSYGVKENLDTAA